MVSAKFSTSTCIETARQKGIEFAKPKLALSHRQFAERYITMPPTGPRGGEKFRVDWQPFVGLLWDAIDNGDWQTAVITGPVQSSKSFSGLVVPTLRDAIELKLDPIVGVPEADMFADKWDKDFRPVLEASPQLEWLIPDKGPGAKGGRVKDRITLGNRVDIKVMSRGGQATNKAGYTSPRLHITEASGFSEASDSDRNEESDPYRQMLGRLGAFKRTDKRRFVTVEGTVTVANQLPWRLRGADDDEMLVSSRSRIVSPCPHCEAWISPEREYLIGWQNAENEQQVADQARFICPACGQPIVDAQRAASMRDCRLVHWGQEITPDGDIVGEKPPTSTLWFRWSAFHNLLLDAADTAVKEWEASQIEEGTLDRENAERDLCQKNWAIPFTSSLADNEPLNPKVVRKRRTEWPRGILPPDTMYVTVGRDIGKWTGYWAAVSFRESGEVTVPAYGCFDICRGPQDDLSTRIFNALREHDERLLEGFHVYDSSAAIVPGRVWTDMGYMPDDVAAATRAAGSGLRARFQCARGRGKSIAGNSGYNHPKRAMNATPIIGMQWYREWNFKRGIPETTFNSDFWILYTQERLRTKQGRKGSLTFFAADTKNEHAKLSNHICSDQLVKEWDAKRGGLVEKWVQSGENHWGDCVKQALAAGNELGFSLRDIADIAVEEAEPIEGTPENADAANFYARLLS